MQGLLLLLRLGGVSEGAHGGEGRWGDPPEEALQCLAKLPAHEAVEDGIEAAVGVCQAHADGEEVHLGEEVLSTEVHYVEFDEDAPRCERLVRQPAQEERQHDNGHWLSHFGAALGAGATAAAANMLVTDEAHQEQVAEADDGQRHHEAQQHLLDVVQT